jgi:hypothetical protein
MKNIIDKHTPLKTRKMPRGPLLQWYNNDIQLARDTEDIVSGCRSRPFCVHYEMFQISKIQPKMPLPLPNRILP